MNISVRRAAADDLHHLSPFSITASPDHLVVISNVKGIPAGIGSLAPLDSESCEVTNLVIFTPFPRQAIAKAIIGSLLQHATGKMVYALPFAEFAELHQELGFSNSPVSAIPPIIVSQLKTRHQTYGKEILLLVKDQRRLG